MTERHQHQQNIEHLASHDSLTGLYNRAKFMECLVAEVALARRQQGRLAVLYLDLDGFAHQRHPRPCRRGPGAGLGGPDLRRSRANQTFWRGWGDEFAVLQRGIDHYDQAVALAQRLADALSQPWTLGKLRVQIGASIGIALYPSGSDPEALLAAADQAMYLVKTATAKEGLLVVPRQTRGGGAPQMS